MRVVYPSILKQSVRILLSVRSARRPITPSRHRFDEMARRSTLQIHGRSFRNRHGRPLRMVSMRRRSKPSSRQAVWNLSRSVCRDHARLTPFGAPRRFRICGLVRSAQKPDRRRPARGRETSRHSARRDVTRNITFRPEPSTVRSHLPRFQSLSKVDGRP